MSRKRSLGVIGLGHVGAHVAYTLAVQALRTSWSWSTKMRRSLPARYRICATRPLICRTGSRFMQAIFRISADVT